MGDHGRGALKNGGVVKAAFLTLDEQRRKPVQRELDGTWPVWSTLVREGLLTVSPQEAALWPIPGPAHRIPLNISEFATQAVLRGHRRRGRGCWLAMGVRGGVRPGHRGATVADGQRMRVWESGYLSLGTQDDRVIVAGDAFMLVYDAWLGEMVDGLSRCVMP